MGVFTPGEWKDEYILGGSYKVVCGDQDIAYCYLGQEENARLIAAAPEMYEVLNIMCSYIKEFEKIFPNFPDALSLWAEQSELLIARIDGKEVRNHE